MEWVYKAFTGSEFPVQGYLSRPLKAAELLDGHTLLILDRAPAGPDKLYYVPFELNNGIRG